MSVVLPPPDARGTLRAGLFRLLGEAGLLLIASLLLALSVALFWESLGWQVRMLTPFRPQYLVGGLLLLLAATWLRFSWFTRGACVAIVAVNGWVLWPWLLPIRDACPESSFLLMSWNTWTDHPEPQQVIAAAAASGADVVLLCETPMSWRGRPAPVIPGYTTAVHDQYVLGVRQDGPVELLASRLARPPYCLEAIVLLEDRPLRLLATHQARPTSVRGCQIQDAQHARMELWRDTSGVPCLVAGDFNATPWCGHLARCIKKMGLRDASRGYGVDSTYPTSPPIMSRLCGVPIDQVFYSPELATGRRWIGAANGSNHRPVFVRVGWRRAPPDRAPSAATP
ncbi:MAG: endonuclease/exonuclease/phosphatase family protein [Planctomycetales bacterium]|nr:endonuclease/exonuclease/phosphatase family protein [Planctomycetales bacterium]